MKDIFDNKKLAYIVAISSLIVALLLTFDILPDYGLVLMLTIFAGIGSIFADFKLYCIWTKKIEGDFIDTLLIVIGLNVAFWGFLSFLVYKLV